MTLYSKMYNFLFVITMTTRRNKILSSKHDTINLYFFRRIRTGGNTMNHIADPNRIVQNDSFACRSLPNLTDVKVAGGNNPPIWGQFHFVASRTSTATYLSSRDNLSTKTISFVDFTDTNKKPPDKYGDDDDKVRISFLIFLIFDCCKQSFTPLLALLPTHPSKMQN